MSGHEGQCIRVLMFGLDFCFAAITSLSTISSTFSSHFWPDAQMGMCRLELPKAHKIAQQ